MTIAMRLVVQLDISEYWTTSKVISTPFFPLVSPRNRFWLLLCLFHLADNEQVWRGIAGHNTLFKLRLLYKNIVHAFWSVFSPHQHLSLDEGMVPWLGKLSFRVYNPDKPKKYGIKAYILCDPVTIVRASNCTQGSRTYFQVQMELPMILWWTWCEDILARVTLCIF